MIRQLIEQCSNVHLNLHFLWKRCLSQYMYVKIISVSSPSDCGAVHLTVSALDYKLNRNPSKDNFIELNWDLSRCSGVPDSQIPNQVFISTTIYNQNTDYLNWPFTHGRIRSFPVRIHFPCHTNWFVHRTSFSSDNKTLSYSRS